MRARFSALFLLGFYDELWSGVAVVAAPAVEQSYAFDHDGYTFWVFALPLLCSAAIEAPLAVASDRIGQRRVLALGMLLLSAALVLGASTQQAWLFSLALALAGAGSGAACAAAQGELIATSALGPARAMSRWTAYAALGDALTPLLITALAWCGFGYRAALLALGLVTFAQALVYRRAPPGAPESVEHEQDAASLATALRALVQQPRLTLLLLTSSLCCLLDEVVVALAALHMRLDQAHSLSVVGAGSTLIAVGGIAGALLSERALAHTDARRVLLGSSVCSLVALVLLTQTSSVCAVLLLLALLGCAVAPHHALIQAAAYEQLPGRPGLVNAALQLFVLVEIAAPLAVGMIAAQLSLTAALLALSVQPLAVGWVALRALRSRRDSPPQGA